MDFIERHCNVYVRIMACCILFLGMCILATLSNLLMVEMMSLYMFFGICTIAWTEFIRDKFHSIVFGICTFISVMLSMIIFTDSNPITISLFAILSQVMYALVYSIGNEF